MQLLHIKVFLPILLVQSVNHPQIINRKHSRSHFVADLVPRTIMQCGLMGGLLIHRLQLFIIHACRNQISVIVNFYLLLRRGLRLFLHILMLHVIELMFHYISDLGLLLWLVSGKFAFESRSCFVLMLILLCSGRCIILQLLLRFFY